ncbi:lectin BRA-3-like [Asterias amurensis]|uniref:lectin BRA-3-like n=1 Tax=Asterias amurensis TaxID=7602 RepID=UPI003AB3AF93
MTHLVRSLGITGETHATGSLRRHFPGLKLETSVLVVPTSDQENEFISQFILTYGRVWIDCNDLEVEGTVKCREGNEDVAYRNWYSSQPNNRNGDEDCAVLTTMWGSIKGQWHEVNCYSPLPALCKMAGRPVFHV